MSVASGPAPSRPTRKQKLRAEWRIYRRDGLVRYVRGVITLRRFHRAVARMEEDDRARSW